MPLSTVHVAKRLSLSLALFATTLVGLSSAQAADWPQFRGPNGNGVLEANNLPMEWSGESNLA